MSGLSTSTTTWRSMSRSGGSRDDDEEAPPSYEHVSVSRAQLRSLFFSDSWACTSSPWCLIGSCSRNHHRRWRGAGAPLSSNCRRRCSSGSGTRLRGARAAPSWALLPAPPVARQCEPGRVGHCAHHDAGWMRDLCRLLHQPSLCGQASGVQGPLQQCRRHALPRKPNKNEKEKSKKGGKKKEKEGKREKKKKESKRWKNSRGQRKQGSADKMLPKIRARIMRMRWWSSPFLPSRGSRFAWLLLADRPRAWLL